MKSLNELIWNNEDLNDDAESTLNVTSLEAMVALCGGFGGGGVNGCGFAYSH